MIPAAVIGSTALDVKGGSITLDAGRAPHVEGSVTVAVPDAATLNLLDPRLSPRVQVTCGQRVFDLAVRDRGVPQRDAEVTLALASDEALLSDYAPMADDSGPRARESSLRAVCDYVLSRVRGIPRNDHPNPSLTTNLDGYSASLVGTLSRSPVGGVDGGPCGVMTITAGGPAAVYGPTIPVISGQVWTFSVYVRSAAGSTIGGRSVRLRAVHMDGPAGGPTGPAVPITAAWQRISMTVLVTSGVTQMRPDIYLDDSTVVGAFVWDWFQAELSPTLTPYRDRVLAPGTNDANITAYWPLTNLLPNPAPGALGSDWQIGYNGTFVGSVVKSPASPAGQYAIQWNATSAGTSTLAAGAPSSYRVQAGKWYVFSVYLCSAAATNARAALQWRSRGGVGTLATVYGAVVSSVSSQYRRLTVIAQAPVGAESVWPFIDTAGNTAGRSHWAAAAMLYEGTEAVEYFDGAKPNTDHYVFAWADWEKPNNSASTRTPAVYRDPASLRWKAGQSALEFLHPLVQAAGLRLVCDEARIWTLRDETYTAPGSTSIRYGINLIDGRDTIARDEGIWFDAAVTRYTWTDLDGIEREAVDSYALPGYTRVRLFEKSTPYPGPGHSAYAVRRAFGRGREVEATAEADWRAHAEQPVAVWLDGAPVQVGHTQSVTFDLDRSEMTITTRSVDTPTGSIDLLPGAINALTGPINNL